jgi:hypothetical protein
VKVVKKIVVPILSGLMTFLMFASSAYGMKSDYETVSDYHKKEIEQLLKDYTLEESLTIRVELKRKDEKEAPEKYVNIPGLYQKTGDSSDSKIESVLNLYERKVVLIQKREISEKELKLVKSSLNERLFMPAETQFTLLDDIPKVGDAVKNMKSDFVFGAYNTLIKNGQFLWILIFSIGFIVALWVLAKVWKSKSESGGAGGEISMTGGGESSGQDVGSADDTVAGGSGAGGVGSISMSNSEFETFNFGSLCSNINDAFKRSPGSTAHIMWSQIPDLQSQIQFYEIIRIQNQIEATIISETYKVLDEIFAFEKRASSNKHKRGKGFDKSTLSTISVELARLKFVKPHEQIEKAFGALYPFKSDHMEAVFKDGLSEHYIVLYKLFKDDFMNYVSNSDDSSVLDKINDLLMFDPETDQASDDQYTAFSEFLSNKSFDEAKEEKKGVNAKIVYMIYGLSEEELGRVEAMKSNEDLKAEIPCMTWINLEDAHKFKAFMISLTGPETKCFVEHDKSHEEALESMDDRTKFRVQEKITQAKGSSINWRQFRNKIKKHYTYQSDVLSGEADEVKNDVAKAS